MAHTTIYDATGSVLKAVQVADNDDRIRFVTQQEIDPVVQYAKEMADGDLSKEMRPVAEIPMVIVEKMMQEGSWNDPAAMKKWLNDPANDCFRIWRGKV